MDDSQPKSRQGGGADPADAAAGSSPEANGPGGGATEGLDQGAKDVQGGDGGGGGDDNAAGDRGLERGDDGGGGGDDVEGGGVGGVEDGAETMESHGKAEEVWLHNASTIQWLVPGCRNRWR